MNARPEPLPALVLGALGVVFGDIGTSPLYAIGQCFRDVPGKSPAPADILGVLSLVFWSLLLVVCVKYITFILRADYNGEGGTLALLGQVRAQGRKPLKPLGGLVLLVFFGSALLYGDGIITPSISVLSAVEGLKIATPAAEPYIVPICLAILAGLFLLQRFGTGGIGRLFGPVMTAWFVVIGVLGAASIRQTPRVLEAVNPAEALVFLGRHGLKSILVLGAVVLTFSGVEALFADLGHFGRRPICLAWYGVALPALLLNYFGQGALVLAHPEAAGSPFYALVPKAALYPMVALATVATIIASQAVISGAFSLSRQAIHLGYFPPLRIVHTSEKEEGQIYVGAINWALMLGCLAVVMTFRSSERLTGAYGLALSGTMTVTSITYYFVLRRVRGWPRAGALVLAGSFIAIDLCFLAGNLAKLLSGAWFPLVIAAVFFSIYWIWTAGHNRYKRALRKRALPIPTFLQEWSHTRRHHEGTAIFLTGHQDSVPLMAKNPWLRQQAGHERIILLTVQYPTAPRVCEKDVTRIERLAPDFFRITTEFGFLQEPDITRILEAHAKDLHLDEKMLVCYLPEPKIVPRGSLRRRATARIYAFLRRNSLTIADYFRIPPREIVHVGVRLEI